MNLLKLLTTVVAVAALGGAAVLADTPATSELPNTGTYFLISAQSDEALQPQAPTPGQS